MAWMIPAAVAGSAALNYLGSQSAADKQGEAAGRSSAEMAREYDQSRSDLAPYREAGTAALTRLRSLLGLDTGGDPATSPLLRKFTKDDLTADPVYNTGLEFGLTEGEKALERRATAGGGYDSGTTLKALTRFATDYGGTKAGESYGRFTNDQDRTFGKLSGVAGMGSGATNVGVNSGANYAGNLSNLYTGLGNAQAASTIAGTNAVSGGLNNYLQYNLLSQLTPGGQRKLQGYDPGSSDSTLFSKSLT